MTSWITICDTCKRDDWDAESGITDGEALAALIEAEVAAQIPTQEANASVKTRRVSCLMGCSHGCNIAVQSAGKLAYTLGRFEASAEDASAIVSYAVKHAATENGQVPYREWPQGVKGHFVTRHPPLPATSE